MELMTPVVILAALGGMYMLIFGRLKRHPGRPARAPFASYRSVEGSGGAGAIVLTAVAFIQLTRTANPVAAGMMGGCLALVMGLAMKSGGRTVVSVAADLFGVVAAIVTAARFASTSHSDVFEQSFRLLILGVMLLVFGATVLLLGRGRFLTGHRGLALFALVDIVAFVASPGGVDLLGLGTGRAQMVLLLGAALALLLGVGASEYLLTATAALVVGISAIAATSGISTDPGGSAVLLGGLVSGLIALKFVGL